MINNSDRIVSTDEQTASKRMKLCCYLKEIPKGQIIADMESAIRTLLEEQAKIIRTDSSSMLLNAQQPKKNLTTKQEEH